MIVPAFFSPHLPAWIARDPHSGSEARAKMSTRSGPTPARSEIAHTSKRACLPPAACCFPSSGLSMYRSCHCLVLLATVMVVASCDRHPIAPAVETRSSLVQPQLPEPFRALSWDDPSMPLHAAVDDQAAVPPGGQSTPLRAVVDDHPAWSPDGRFIAFHRRYPSSYGPPGLYIIPHHGGEPRLLLPGGFFFPREVSFSPDGQRLVCSDNNQLAFVDIATGAVSRPLFTDNGAGFPDWSPDGRFVAYGRKFLSQFPREPVDSAGLHVLDVATGLDRPLRHGDAVLPSGFARWIRGGQGLAFIHGGSGGVQSLSVATLDGREFFTVMSVPFPKLLWNLQHLGSARPRSGPLATESLVMLVIGAPAAIERTLQVTTDPFVISDRRLLGLWDALSPTGRKVAVIRPDPADSLGVLYVGQADGPPRARMKQLTRYEPPELANWADQEVPHGTGPLVFGSAGRTLVIPRSRIRTQMGRQSPGGAR